ncbi:hypothetical protein DFH07DRAFT_175723 [Mycena maculata]|uniref:Uncharacterized protein n=1 Tax=Mycena maculata TaxID=230809 RepID=A0AAD7MTQ7_9AGAR|nr:hypothetical protein DFH07DRAFT_175723 [Mycena maculata]
MMPPKHLISFDCGGIHSNRAQYTLVRAHVCWLLQFPSKRCVHQSAAREEPLEVDLPSSQPARRGLHRVVSTLTPSLLTERDYLDLAGFEFFYRQVQHTFIPFPHHARGFLYRGTRPYPRPLAASLRFRCTPTAHPFSFDDGHDLLCADGLPWQWLTAQATVSASPILRGQLVLEGRLTLDAVAKWRKRLGWVEGRNCVPRTCSLRCTSRSPLTSKGDIPRYCWGG